MNINEFRDKLNEIIDKPIEGHETAIAQLCSQCPRKIKIKEKVIFDNRNPNTMHTWAYICFMYALNIMHPNPKTIRDDVCLPEKDFVEYCISNNLLKEISQPEVKNDDIIIYFACHDFKPLGDKIDINLFKNEYKIKNYKFIDDVLLSYRKGYKKENEEMYKRVFWEIVRIPNLPQLFANNEGINAAQKVQNDSGLQDKNTKIISEIYPYTFRKKPAHAGKVHNDKIASKWGCKGHLWEHDIWEVPLRYGDELKFYKRRNGINFKDKFVEYIKLKGCSTDMINYWEGAQLS